MSSWHARSSTLLGAWGGCSQDSHGHPWEPLPEKALPLALAHRSSPEANMGQILNHQIKLSSLDRRLWASLPAVDQQQL